MVPPGPRALRACLHAPLRVETLGPDDGGRVGGGRVGGGGVAAASLHGGADELHERDLSKMPETQHLVDCWKLRKPHIDPPQEPQRFGQHAPPALTPVLQVGSASEGGAAGGRVRSLQGAPVESQKRVLERMELGQQFDLRRAPLVPQPAPPQVPHCLGQHAPRSRIPREHLGSGTLEEAV